MIIEQFVAITNYYNFLSFFLLSPSTYPRPPTVQIKLGAKPAMPMSTSSVEVPSNPPPDEQISWHHRLSGNRWSDQLCRWTICQLTALPVNSISCILACWRFRCLTLFSSSLSPSATSDKLIFRWSPPIGRWCYRWTCYIFRTSTVSEPCGCLFSLVLFWFTTPLSAITCLVYIRVNLVV